MNGIKLAGIEVDRKVMADLAVRDEAAFKALVDQARKHQPKASVNAWLVPTRKRLRKRLAAIDAAETPDALETVRIETLGKKAS